MFVSYELRHKQVTYFTNERITQASGSPEIAPNSSKFTMQDLNNHLVDHFKTQCVDTSKCFKVSREARKQ